MRPAPFRPLLQVFVCTNRRAADDPLGGGCAERGEALWRELRTRIASAGLGGRVWVTRTLCQGVCPKEGTAVSLSPGGIVLTDVGPEDADALFIRMQHAARA